MLFEKN